jgi:putative signal transducing protein
MAYCPECRMEYEAGVATCTDCGSVLVAGTMPAPADEQGRPDERWTTLMRVRRLETAEIVRGLLDSAGIESEVIDKTTSEMPLPALETISYLEICVPESAAAEARRVLNETREGTIPCPTCGHMSSAEEAVCEYCEAALC